MTNAMTHKEIRELLGVYAIGALERVEKAEVERHLETCVECAAEVQDHRQVLAALTEDAPPPTGPVWDRIAGALEESTPPLDLVRVSRLSGQRRSVSLRLAGLVAAAAAVVIAFLGNQVIQQNRRIDSILVTRTESGLLRAAAEASANPSAERIELHSQDESLIANLVVLPDGNGFIVRDNLPALPADRTYQLWALVNSSKISLGVLGTDPGVAAFRVVAPSKGFAITDENAGGVAITERMPVVVGFRHT